APLIPSAGAAVGTEGVPFDSVVASFIDLNPNASANDFSASIDWGDGGQSAGIVTANNQGGFDVTGTHVYAEDGDYHVFVSVSDSGGSGATVNITAHVGNARPIVHVAPTFGISGTHTELLADFSDSGLLDTHTAVIDWGDGSQSAGPIVETSLSGYG